MDPALLDPAPDGRQPPPHRLDALDVGARDARRGAEGEDQRARLCLAQLARLPDWLAARLRVAAWYDDAFAAIPHATPLAVHEGREHAYHLYVIRLAPQIDRDTAFAALRGQGIGANVHYAPVHLMGFYRSRGYGPGLAPVAEEAARHILTLPMFPAMTKTDVACVAEALAALG